MKAVITIRINKGYLIIPHEIGSLSTTDVSNGTVVSDDEYSPRDKAGRVASEILNPYKEEKENV